MMLARRGHEVTVLERNAEEQPDTIDKAWEAWERPGVAQFRMGHYFLARFCQVIEAELPELQAEFDAAGALRTNPIDNLPPTIADRTPRDDDRQFDVVTGRRPVIEWVVSRAAASRRGLEVRRGVGVAGLVTGPSAIDGVPHVVGVRTEAGDELRADLVIDAGGRRSAYGSWLQAIGGRPFYEEEEDSGFRYYGRYFKVGPNGWPDVPAPVIGMLGSVATLALPADNDTWMVGIVTSAKDKALYGLADEAAWMRGVASISSAARWLDGEPITDVETMVAIPDRYRRFIVDDQPVATGIAAIADAFAATNPMRGRGVSMGMLHAQCLMRAMDHLDDPAEFARVFDAATEEELTPYYRDTIALDRGLRDAFDREVLGIAPPEAPAGEDPMAEMQARFFALIGQDADVFRGFAKLVGMLDHPMNIVATEPILSKVLAFEGEAGSDPLAAEGPSRQELIDLVNG